MERFVELRRPGGLMRGMIHLPDRRAFRPPWPGVVLYHGFTGHRMEPNFLFVRFSRLLAENGIASVRFDFLGSGESDGRFEDMTFSGEVEDALAVLEFLRRRRGVDRRRVYLLGLSMGGSIAGYVAGLRGAEIKGLVLWAPAGEMSERIRERFAALQAGPVPPGLPAPDPFDVDGLRLGKGFVTDAQGLRILETTSRYQGPVLIIHGTGDQTVSPHVASRYEELFGSRARLKLIDDANHVFEGAAWQGELYRLSLEFIAR